jgi:signal transduction histidine kinase
MKFRFRLFFILLSIVFISFSFSYFIVTIAVKNIIKNNVEEKLTLSLYSNFQFIKEFINNFNSLVYFEFNKQNINEIISKNHDFNNYFNKFVEDKNLSFLSIRKENEFIFTKSILNDVDNNFIMNNLSKYNLDFQDALINDKIIFFFNIKINSLDLLIGIQINELFIKKLYDYTNINFYWNERIIISTNRIFDKDIDNNILKKLSKDFSPSETNEIFWNDRIYKIKYQKITDNLIISSMLSNLFEEEIFNNIKNKFLLLLIIFILFALIISLYISNNLLYPFYKLAEGIQKKDKNVVKSLINRKDEIGNLANEFWNITQDLIKKEEQKEILNSLIAHDLKTPLVAILRNLENLNKNIANISIEKKTYLINLMIKNINQSLELINNLLKVQKYELGKIKLFISNENINNLINESINSLMSISQEKNIKIITDLDNDINNILLDKTEIKRVINNLLSNAIKYTPENGEVKIITKLNINDNNIIVRIIDNGKGIPLYQQRQLFNFYTSGQNNYKENSQDISTGLGLYLCKQIVNSHGGEIGVESYTNKGSCFYFTLPLR